VEPKEAVLAWVGDGNNVANSLMLLAAVLGFDLRLATPKSHQPALMVRRRSEELARASGARIEWTSDPRRAVRGAQFIYTDTWTSMGQEAEAEMRRRIFSAYQVNADLMAEAGDPWVMHCLPAHRGEEITDEVLDGPRSLVYEQAENRLHAQKAILERLMIGAVS
jgi:ornithine carbamoyltransferase